MEGVSAPDKFDFTVSDQKNEWKIWKKNFILWLVGTERTRKSNEVKIGLLLTVMGRDAQEIYDTFEWGRGQQQTFDTAIEKFDEFFEPRANKTMARFKFFACDQGDKSAKEFVTELKKLAEPCEFGDMREELIKDMIVLHCRDERLQERLLRKTDLDLQEAVMMANTAEETDKDVKTIRNGGQGASEHDGALMMRARAGVDTRGSSGHRWTRENNGGGRDGQRGPMSKAEEEENQWREQMRGKCFKCHQFGHKVRECPENASHHSQKEEANHVEDYDAAEVAEDEYVLLAKGDKKKSSDNWYFDSGATKHMSRDKRMLGNFRGFRNPCHVRLGDGHVVKAYGKGRVQMPSGSGSRVVLEEVFYVPELSCNLISVKHATGFGARVLFGADTCHVLMSGQVCLTGQLDSSGLYALDT